MSNKLILDHIRLALSSSQKPSSDFDLNPEDIEITNNPLISAAVLIPIVEKKTGLHILLTKRSSQLKKHPSQISFPGGKKEPRDTNLEQTALRESSEEIGLPSEIVQFLGSLPCHETVTNFEITPYIGFLTKKFEPKINSGEVAELFSVPLEYLLKTDNFVIQSRHWHRKKRYYYTIPYGPHYIWGVTARILRGLAEAVSK